MTHLSDNQIKLLGAIAARRSGVLSIPNNRGWRAWTAESLEELGLIRQAVGGGKLHLTLTPEGQKVA